MDFQRLVACMRDKDLVFFLRRIFRSAGSLSRLRKLLRFPVSTWQFPAREPKRAGTAVSRSRAGFLPLDSSLIFLVPARRESEMCRDDLLMRQRPVKSSVLRLGLSSSSELEESSLKKSRSLRAAHVRDIIFWNFLSPKRYFFLPSPLSLESFQLL
jgi:hypothetical protein